MEEKEQKKVVVPWEEYQGLLKDSESLKEAREELKKDCKERGTYMEYKIFLSTDKLIGISHVSIISKEKSLKEAQNEIDRLLVEVKNFKDIAEQHEKTIDRLRSRNLWARIFNKW